MFTDIAQGSVPALLPFLKAADHLSLAALSALVLAATISSSVIQPLFGHVSDRVSLPWLMPLGPALGGLGIALAGFAPSYGLTFAAIVLSGLGVAAFHPEGSRFANYVSGARRARGMSLFSVGGNIGFALGPVLVTPLLFDLRPTRHRVLDHPHRPDGRGPAARAPAPGALPRRPGRRQGAARRAHRGLGTVRAAGRRHRAAVVRLLRDGHVHPALLRRRVCTPARRSAARP